MFPSLPELYCILIAQAAATFSSLSGVAFHMYNVPISLVPCLML